jgi:hypothetical protein
MAQKVAFSETPPGGTEAAAFEPSRSILAKRSEA